jgi:hypothetical protein
MTLERGDIDQGEITGERRMRRAALFGLLAIIGVLIWGFCT